MNNNLQLRLAILFVLLSSCGTNYGPGDIPQEGGSQNSQTADGGGNNSNSNGNNSNSDGTSPSSDGTSPSSDGTSPSSDGTNPSSDGTSPSSDGTSPSSDGTSPSSKGIKPNPDGDNANSKGINANPDGTSPKNPKGGGKQPGSAPTGGGPKTPSKYKHAMDTNLPAIKALLKKINDTITQPNISAQIKQINEELSKGPVGSPTSRYRSSKFKDLNAFTSAKKLSQQDVGIILTQVQSVKKGMNEFGDAQDNADLTSPRETATRGRSSSTVKDVTQGRRAQIQAIETLITQLEALSKSLH
ncbi:MAG: hypothetical protein AAFQ08_01965, partial [Bacteroidota bacterium]